jgi:hypothetical protein
MMVGKKQLKHLSTLGIGLRCQNPLDFRGSTNMRTVNCTSAITEPLAAVTTPFLVS